MVLRSFTRHNFKTRLFVVARTACYNKATGNSDSQNVILETTDNTSTRENEVRK